MIKVLTSWTPRLTEPTHDKKASDHLTSRVLYGDERGGMALGWAFVGLADLDLHLRGPWITTDWRMDLRDQLLAELLDSSCSCLIWWKVTADGHPWSIYAGQWNDQVGFCCLLCPSLELPMVWTSPHPDAMRKTYNLMDA